MYPYPSQSIFGAPSRERCVVKRSRSNTPLQALVTLNDPVFFEAACAFGRRIVDQNLGQTDRRRLEFAFKTALARAPDVEESRVFLNFYREQHKRFLEDIKSAASIAVDRSTDQPVLAAWTMVASTLLNLDETLSHQ